MTFSRILNSWEPESSENRFLGYSRNRGRGKGRCRGKGSRQDHGNRQEGALVVGGRVPEPVGVRRQLSQVGEELRVDLPAPVEQGDERELVEDHHDDGRLGAGLDRHLGIRFGKYQLPDLRIHEEEDRKQDGRRDQVGKIGPDHRESAIRKHQSRAGEQREDQRGLGRRRYFLQSLEHESAGQEAQQAQVGPGGEPRMDSGQSLDGQRRRYRQEEGQPQGQQQDVHPLALVGRQELGMPGQEIVNWLSRGERRQDQKVDRPDSNSGGRFASTRIVHLQPHPGSLWASPRSDDIPTEGEKREKR